MVGGQILSKISGGAVSVVVGIIIVALVSLVVATFGMHIFQYYERYFTAHPLYLHEFAV
jgi:purine-cytosine permease-like protein